MCHDPYHNLHPVLRRLPLGFVLFCQKMKAKVHEYSIREVVPTGVEIVSITPQHLVAFYKAKHNI